MNIGIQGVKASFHDVAARKFFFDEVVVPVECPTFKALCESLKKGESDYAMMAIENSIAGSILTNYTLLETYGFKVIGEIYLHIRMNILALPGQTLSDIAFVQSHPMALLQCQEFLTQLAADHEVKIIEANDTAESAKWISEKQLPKYAAIASELAASTYGLEILQTAIESNQQNYTRFLVICRSGEEPLYQFANKSSICFEVAHQPGSLARVLDVLSEFQVNMTKIQSVPILGRPYQYSFHVDLEWGERTQYHAALANIASHVQHMVQFGEYPRGERPL